MNAWILAVWMLMEAVGTTAQARPASPVLARMEVRAVVSAAAIREGVPPAILNGIHAVECARLAVCPAGDGGDALGPFQIHAETAAWAGCDYQRVVELRHGAACAARILAMKRDLCATWGEAMGHYNSGRCVDGRYAAKVRGGM